MNDNRNYQNMFNINVRKIKVSYFFFGNLILLWSFSEHLREDQLGFLKGFRILHGISVSSSEFKN